MYVRTAGMGAAYVNGVLIPSTADPVGTPVVMNPAPGQNLQIAASVVPEGTLSSSGLACNTDAGYIWNPATALCELPGQSSGAGSAVPAGMFVSTDPATGSQVLSGSPTMSGSPVACTTAACLADMAALNAGGGSAAAPAAAGLFGLSNTELFIGAAVLVLLVVMGSGK